MSPFKIKNIVTDSHNHASHIKKTSMTLFEHQPENNGIHQYQPENTTLYGRHMIPN